jgi:hypothetical protein
MSETGKATKAAIGSAQCSEMVRHPLQFWRHWPEPETAESLKHGWAADVCGW